ncbi:MAG: hypothetical protein RXO36_04570 [Candidatus Nanopusillus acidilobi]
MNDEERIKAMQYEIERQIKEIKEKHTTFVIYLPYALIVADNYEFGEVFKEQIILYRNGNYIASVNIWAIVEIG